MKDPSPICHPERRVTFGYYKSVCATTGDGLEMVLVGTASDVSSKYPAFECTFVRVWEFKRYMNVAANGGEVLEVFCHAYFRQVACAPSHLQ